VAVTAASGGDTTVSWSGSDQTVATVDTDGVLTALALGSTTVTASSTADSSKSDAVAITVVPNPSVRQVQLNTGNMPILGAGLVLLTETAPLVTAAFVEFLPGVYAGPVGPVNEDGSVGLVFPSGTALPDDAIHPVSDLIMSLDVVFGCELTVSEPSVNVTQVSPGPSSNVYLLLADGMFPALVTDTPFDYTAEFEEEFLSKAFISWVYSDGDTTVSLAQDCIAGTTEVVVDLTLKSGWNQVAWHIEVDPDDDEVASFTLLNDDSESPALNLPIL